MPYTIRVTLRIVGAGLVAALVAWSLTVVTAPVPIDAQTKGGGPWSMTNAPGAVTLTFANCTGFGSANSITTLRTQDPATGATVVRTSPGDVQLYPITCDRAYQPVLDLFNWRQDVIGSKSGHERNVTFSYRDPYSGVITQTWSVTLAWPADYFSAFDREVVTFAHDGATRTK